jgi:hypothetical protein
VTERSVTKDEVQRIAANIAKLPELLGNQSDYQSTGQFVAPTRAEVTWRPSFWRAHDFTGDLIAYRH